MGEFLGVYGLAKLNQDEINNVNRPVTSNEVEPVIKNLFTKRSLVLEGFGAEFYHTFKEDLTLIFLKLFHKTKRRDVSKFHLRSQYYLILKLRYNRKGK